MPSIPSDVVTRASTCQFASTARPPAVYGRSTGTRTTSTATCEIFTAASEREGALADDVALVVGVRPHFRLPAPDVRRVVPELRHRQGGVLDLVGAEIARLARISRPIADRIDGAGQLEQERQVLVVVEIVEEGLAMTLDVHHHPEHVGRLARECPVAADPLVLGQMPVHRVRADLARPPARFAGLPPRGAVHDGERVELIGGKVARLGRRGLPVARGAADAGHPAQIRGVLAVINLVERRFMIVSDIHPDQEQRVSAHGNPPWRASIAHMARVGAALVALTLLAAATAQAQELEPRAYTNTPVGMNFLVLGYAYTKGDVALDTSAPIEDGDITIHNAFLAYVRSLDVWGRTGKLQVALPYAWLSGSAKLDGRTLSTDISGLGDPQVKFSLLLYGGPALSLEEFESYSPDLVVGASFSVTAPLGQYDSNRLVNIGTNRWSFKPEIGIAKTWGPVTLELAPSATFYTDNNDFLGRTLQRDPLYAVQGHVVYHTSFGLWAAVDATYYGGGRKTVGGVEGEPLQDVRVGGTLAIPIDRHNSVKLSASTGAYARAGGNFTTAAIAWQFRWGGGL